MRSVWKAALRPALVLLLFGLAVVSSPAQACKLRAAGHLPITMHGPQPLTDGAINGTPMRILVDTGAQQTILWRDLVERLDLRMTQVNGLMMYGVGGATRPKAARVEELRIGDHVVKDGRWLVAGEQALGNAEIGMLLGYDVFSKFDIEVDLADGKMAFYAPQDCDRVALAHWSPQQFMLADLNDTKGRAEITVLLNGKPVKAILDTGASTTVIDADAARRLGVTEDSPDVVEAGASVGIGKKVVRNHVATFETLQIGDEMIRNPKLRIVPMHRYSRYQPRFSRLNVQVEDLPQMLIGADWFLAHRVLISNSQRLVYFTYNGRKPIFQTVPPPGEEDTSDS